MVFYLLSIAAWIAAGYFAILALGALAWIYDALRGVEPMSAGAEAFWPLARSSLLSCLCAAAACWLWGFA